MWWDEHHRDDAGHHTDEWYEIDGEAHKEFFRCLIHDRDRPVKPLWRIVWVVSYAALTA